MADESQRGGELPARAAAVAVGDDAPVGLELQPLQQVRHHLQEERRRRRRCGSQSAGWKPAQKQPNGKWLSSTINETK